MRAIPPLAVLVVVASLALVACGASTTRSTSSRANPAVAVAHCMRAHGVPNFPDPGPHGGMTVLFSPGSSTPSIDGIHFSGPAFTAAARICKPFGQPQPGTPAISAAQKRAALGFAGCMRHHGFPQWADPTFPPGGGIMGGGVPNGKNSPAIEHAAKTCNSTRPSHDSG